MTGNMLSFQLEDGRSAGTTRTLEVANLIIAGWTGRDPAAVEHHIRELEALGVKRPACVPIFYRVSAARLTAETSIQVLGEHTSGEVEFVLVKASGQLWVGTGSDHTDREAESVGVSLSKQICDKPIAPALWPFDAVVPHWDRLILRSFATTHGRRELYQEGPVSALLHPEDLLSRLGRTGLAEGSVMFGGTLPAFGGVRPADRFDFELEDPVRGKTIAHGYDIFTLPVPG
ncbi:MAG TPA: DUF2848 domain-containing protein [Micropepsaceae bacterium]|nr:DUF2848 domain-containing protein [Micropepsaceae bacterium]